MKNLLDHGLAYLHGRDTQLRPILIFRTSVVTTIKTDLDEALKTCHFVIFYMIEHCFLRGKIENWTGITDCDNLAVLKLPIKFIMRFFLELQKHFKSRGFKFFGVGLNLTIRMIWKIVSPIVEEKIKSKILLTNSNIHPDFWKFMHPSQVEERYGGDASNLTDFWPPRGIGGEIGYNEEWFDEEVSSSNDEQEDGTNYTTIHHQFPKDFETPVISHDDIVLETVAVPKESVKRSKPVEKGKNC